MQLQTGRGNTNFAPSLHCEKLTLSLHGEKNQHTHHNMKSQHTHHSVSSLGNKVNNTPINLGWLVPGRDSKIFLESKAGWAQSVEELPQVDCVDGDLDA